MEVETSPNIGLSCCCHAFVFKPPKTNPSMSTKPIINGLPVSVGPFRYMLPHLCLNFSTSYFGRSIRRRRDGPYSCSAEKHWTFHGKVVAAKLYYTSFYRIKQCSAVKPRLWCSTCLHYVVCSRSYDGSCVCTYCCCG